MINLNPMTQINNMNPFVVLAFIIVAGLEIVLPLLLGRWAMKRFGLSWKPFFFGALFFVIVQIIHIPVVLLTQTPFSQWLLQTFTNQALIIGIIALFLGLLAGLFEEPGRYLVFKKFFPSKKIKLTRENALLFGLGWGGIECIFIGLIMFMTMFTYIAAVPLTDVDIDTINQTYGGILTDMDADALKAQYESLMSLTPIDLLPSLFERIMTIILHVAFTLMVFTAIVQARKMWLYIAIAWHAAVDALAVFMASMYGLVATELMILLFALIALWYSKRVFRDISLISVLKGFFRKR